MAGYEPLCLDAAVDAHAPVAKEYGEGRARARRPLPGPWRSCGAAVRVAGSEQ